MKVAIDATPLTLSSGGLPRYTLELSAALARMFPADEFTLISDQPFALPSGFADNLKRGCGPHSLIERRWWLCGVSRAMRRCGAVLFHGTNFMVPWLPLRPSVVTLLDLSPWLEGAWHGDAGFVRRRAPYVAGLRLATMFITPSEAVRAQAMDRFRIHPSRIVTIPLAAAASFRPVARAGGDGVPYFLFLGTLEPRKNLGMLLRAWREVRREHRVDLVLAGRKRADFHEPLADEPGLRVLGEVADGDLPALYSAAAAVLYPSFYEGFGLPPLEAMQCGAVVIASRDSAIRETTGDAAILLDPRDERGWIRTMIEALESPERTHQLRAKALERARLFSWERTAQLTWEVYVEAMRRFGD